MSQFDKTPANQQASVICIFSNILALLCNTFYYNITSETELLKHKCLTCSCLLPKYLKYITGRNSYNTLICKYDVAAT